ncbi:MAG: hypothetical protein GX234_12585 [Clostridiales bacterium]|nr:hypothetical protein [Clostridiales bacterium]
MSDHTASTQNTQFAADTSNRTIKEWILALLVLLIGLTIAHLGVSLFLLSNLGTDTFTIFIQGLALTIGLSVGTVHVIILCLIMFIMLFTTRGYIKPGTVICAFCGGPIIDLFNWILTPYIHAGSSLPIRIGAMLAGCIILSLGMSVVIASNAGTGPNDLVALVLTDKLKRFQFRTVRIGCDLFFVIIGFVLGGTLGAGTLAAALLTGPLVQFWLPKSSRIIRRLY